MLDPADHPAAPDSTAAPDSPHPTQDPPRATDSPRADCCGEIDPRIAHHFNNRLAELMEDGKLPEMVDVSEMLLGLLGDVAERRPTLLELGCGSGALAVELLTRGAVSADGIDLSPDMIGAARRRANEAGVADRASFEVGDGALTEMERHDWVVMDRVICCYPHPEGLVGNATRAATRRVAFTVPTSRGWRGLVNRVGWALENVPSRVFRRDECATFVHDIGRIERVLAQAGFSRTAEDRLGLWYGAVWERPA